MIIEGNWAEVNSEWRCLQNELGWYWEYSWNYKLFIIFVLHEKCIFLCFEGRARAEFSWGETAEKWSKLKEHWGWIGTRKLVLEITWKSLPINDQTKHRTHDCKNKTKWNKKSSLSRKSNKLRNKMSSGLFFYLPQFGNCIDECHIMDPTCILYALKFKINLFIRLLYIVVYKHTCASLIQSWYIVYTLSFRL